MIQHSLIFFQRRNLTGFNLWVKGSDGDLYRFVFPKLYSIWTRDLFAHRQGMQTVCQQVGSSIRQPRCR